MSAALLAEIEDGITIMRETLKDGTVVWVARDDDLPGCIAQAETADAARAELKTAREDYLATLRSLGRPIPSRPTAARVVTWVSHGVNKTLVG